MSSGQCLNDLAWLPGQPRGGPSIAFSEEKVYRIGAYDGNAEIGGLLDVYDIATDAWESISYQADGIEGPSPISVGALVAVHVDDKSLLLYIFGEGQASSLGQLA